MSLAPKPAQRSYHHHTAAINAAAWVGDGRHIATAGGDRTVQVWPADPPAASRVAATTGGTGLENASSETPAFLWGGHTMVIQALASSPDRTMLASGSYDGTIQVVSTSTGSRFATYMASTRKVYSLDWSRFGNLLAVGGDQGRTVVCHAMSGEDVRHFDYDVGTAVTGVSFSPRGQALATGHTDGVMTIWSMARPKEGVRGHAWSPERFSCALGEETVTSVAWSPDGRQVAAGCGKTVQLWFAGTGKHIRNLGCHRYTGTIFTVAWSPNGMYLAAAGNGGVVQVWDETGRPVSTFLYDHPEFQTAVNTLAWSPDGKFLVAAGEGKCAKVWAVEDDLFPDRMHTAAVEPPCWPMFDWPAWVPEAVRLQVEEFWDDSTGRDPQQWIADSVAQGAPPFGLTVTLRSLGAWDPPLWETGRYVHLCNNIGRLVHDDGTWAYVSFHPTDSWEGHDPQSQAPKGRQDVPTDGGKLLLAFVETGCGVGSAGHDWDMKRLCLFTAFRVGLLRAQQLRRLAYVVAKTFSTLLKRAPGDTETLRIATELFCLRTLQQRDATEEEVVGLLQQLRGGFEQGQAALARFRQAEDDSPDGWAAEGVWPAWVPEAVRERIVKFWTAREGLGLPGWQRDRVAQGAPPLGEQVTLRELVAAGETPNALTGRYVHYWGNIGCLVLGDGRAATVSFAPTERWDGAVEQWGTAPAVGAGQGD